MTVEELDERISSAEFAQWIAYANLEPFGYPMENYRMGVPAAAIVNAVRATIPLAKGRARPKSIQATDFYPKQAREKPELTPEQRRWLQNKRRKNKRPVA